MSDTLSTPPPPSNALAFGANAGNYAAARQEYDPEQLAWVKAFNGITESSTVVDVGAGTGLLSKNFAPASLICVELDAGMRTQGATHLTDKCRFTYVDGTASAMPSVTNKYADLIVVGDAAHWFGNPEPVVKEFRRILKPGGKIAIFARYESLQDPLMARLNSLLEQHCPEDWNGTPERPVHRFIKDPNDTEAMDLRKGAKLINQDPNLTRDEERPGGVTAKNIKTCSQEFTREQFYNYLASYSALASWNNADDTKRERIKTTIIEPIFAEFAKGKNTITTHYISQVHMGPPAILARAQDKAVTPPR